MRLIPAMRRRLRGEEGFTMATVMAGMLLVMLISVAAVAAAGGDIGLARYDQDDKQAYAAAEAGVSDYLGNLNADSNYWAKCTDVTAPVSQRGAVTGAPSPNGRRWKDVPGSSDSEYSIELIPAPGQTQCNPNDPLASMVRDGNVRIRATGRVKGKNIYRTVNATFRRTGFLDFLYYTKFENQDPTYFKRSSYANATTRPTNGAPALKDWVAVNCQRLWWGEPTTQGQGRGSSALKWTGEVYLGTWNGQEYWYPVNLDTDNVGCGEIQFISGDVVRGPFHSEDSILICGTPSFGRPGDNDRVEIVAPSYRVSPGSNCSDNPTFNPELIRNASTLQPPPTNAALKDLTLPAYKFTGQTKIKLTGTAMEVNNPNLNNGATTTMNLPPNGVIYVSNATTGEACGQGYDPTDPTAEPAGCGDVKLSGYYTKDLTIAAQNDIIATESVTRPTDDKSLLGLIAGKFMRVWHPACNNTPNNIRIDAAILALDGSFTVDNYWCGGALGNLTVNGAIAQLHRGVVGTGSGDGMNGYLKNYFYNEDLKFRSPPHFLDPLESSWRVLRQGEQSPPAKQ